MKKYQLASLLLSLVALVQGQSLVDVRTQTKNVDFSGAASTIPAKSGTTLPGTCNVGEQFFKTNNTPGQNLYSCAPANTWTQIAGSTTNGTVSTATSGQFGFYAGSGNTIIGHTLTPSDIPALSYQSLLTFTGNGAKTASSTGTILNNDCAKWDANGNIIDAGGPCATVSNGSAGQFGFYSATGSTISPHTLVAGDIPALNYQAPLTFTGNGAKTVSSTGSLTANDCAKWDVNGNIIDAGGPCATVASGAAGQFAFYSAAGSALSPHSLAASDIPALNYQSPLSFTGTGAKTITSTAAGASNNCAKWDANGNVVDAGAPCAGGSGGIGAPSSTTIGNVPQFGNTSGTALSTGLGVVSVVGSPGLDTNVPTEKSVRTALAATVASGTAGQFGFYSAAGSAISSHTLVASDIPALNYQAPLTFTGNGSKTVSSTGALTTSNCAKWDANGNIIDAGVPCSNGNFPSLGGGTNTSGAFVIGSGAALSASGTGSITATSVPASGVTGLAASATTDTTNASNIASGTLSAARLPATAVTTSLATGTGSKYASASASGVANNCVKWDSSGNIVDAGAPCGSGSGSTLSTPSSTTVGNIPQFSNTSGSAISAGVALVTTLGSPGVDTNIATEKAVRSAIAASGALPAQTGSAGYLVSNGTTATFADLLTGPSGALCAGLGCSGGTSGIVDIVTSVVPRLAAANTFTGVNKFQQLQVSLYTVATLPACNSSFEGQMEGVTDAVSPSYLATVTGGGSVHVPVYCNGTSWVAH